MNRMVYTDPQTGRQYTVNPATGLSEWLVAPQPAPDLGLPAVGHITAGRPPKKRRTWLKVSGGVVGALLAIGAVGAAVGGGGNTAQTTAAVHSPTKKATTVAHAATPAETESDAPTPAPKPVTHKAVTARTWKLIAKDPDKYYGQAVIVYGHVTQFDSATGADAFRANVDGVKHAESYEYDTNTILVGSEDALRDLVADDLFVARVTVDGSLSYETMMGGETTVPRLRVDSIKVTGTSS